MILFLVMNDLNMSKKRGFVRVFFVTFVMSAGEVFRFAMGCHMVSDFLTFCARKRTDFAVELVQIERKDVKIQEKV